MLSAECRPHFGPLSMCLRSVACGIVVSKGQGACQQTPLLHPPPPARSPGQFLLHDTHITSQLNYFPKNIFHFAPGLGACPREGPLAAQTKVGILVKNDLLRECSGEKGMRGKESRAGEGR